MGSSCTTLNPVKVVKPFKNTPGESSTQPDTLQIEEKRSSTDRKGSKKYKKGLDEGSTYIGSVPLNSRNNIVSTGDCLEEGARLPSLHFLTEEDCGEVPAMLEESQSKKSAHFEKGPLIGKGSCGEVYECLNLKTGELVAVKEIRLSGGVSEIQRYTSVLKKENVLFKTLNHPNIIRHYETEIIELKDQTHLLINISVEYVSGGSIRTLLNKFRNLDEKVVMIYMRQILEGLSYLHRMGIVHTNLKGTNILIDASGIVKLSDFGSLRLDRFSEENPLNSNRMSATAKNFMHWAAPEVMKSQKYSKAADVWSAGCVIIEMLTGSPPWNTHGDNFEETLNMISCGNLPPLPAYTSDICRDFLQKTFQLKPEDRATVDDLLDHPFVRDVTPSNSYFESDTLLSGLSGRASEMRNNSSYERYLNPRGNELRVPYLDITAHKGQFLRNRLRRGYPNEYVMKGGIIKSPSNSNAVPVNEIEVEELDMEPITLKVPVPTLNKVKEAPSEDEFTPNTSQKQFFASRPRHLLGKASRERMEKEAKEMTEEEKAEKRRQLELEMMMELDQQSLNESNAEDTDRLVEREALNQEQVEQEAEDEKPEEERLKTIPDEGALTTENSIMDCRGMDISEELDPQKEDQGSAEDPQKSLEDEIEKRFAEIRSNNSRTFWTWERENENEDQNENEENDGRQTGKDDETRETNNPVSIIDCQTLKSQEIKQMVVHPKSEKRLIMPNPEMIKITKKRGSDGKSDDHGRGNLTDVIELPEDEGGIHRRELSLRFSSELYQTMKSPQALEYLEKKLNAIGEVVEREENKEVSRDYDDKENRGFNIYMS